MEMTMTQQELFPGILYRPVYQEGRVVIHCPVCRPKKEVLVPIGANSYACPACDYVQRLTEGK